MLSKMILLRKNLHSISDSFLVKFLFVDVEGTLILIDSFKFDSHVCGQLPYSVTIEI
jgi:hypothetical protein